MKLWMRIYDSFIVASFGRSSRPEGKVFDLANPTCFPPKLVKDIKQSFTDKVAAKR